MWFSSLFAFLNAKKTGSLGKINPYPYVFGLMNNIGWVVYSIVLHNPFIYAANIFGVILNLYFTVNCLVLLSKKDDARDIECYNKVEKFLFGSISFFCFLTLFIGVIKNFMTFETLNNCLKYLSLLFNVTYVLSLNGTIVEVFQTRDTSGIVIPFMIINLLNALLWMFYGLLGENNVAIYGPNMLCIVCVGINFSLKFYFEYLSSQSRGSTFKTNSNNEEVTIGSPMVSANGSFVTNEKSRSSLILNNSKQGTLHDKFLDGRDRSVDISNEGGSHSTI